jgi:hypothetical protein
MVARAIISCSTGCLGGQELDSESERSSERDHLAFLLHVEENRIVHEQYDRSVRGHVLAGLIVEVERCPPEPVH